MAKLVPAIAIAICAVISAVAAFVLHKRNGADCQWFSPWRIAEFGLIFNAVGCAIAAVILWIVL
jgi:hypothetical protein